MRRRRLGFSAAQTERNVSSAGFEARASKPALETFLSVCAAENPNRRLRMTALQDRVSMTVERADFDDLVTLVTQGATWDKDRIQGARTVSYTHLTLPTN